MASNRPGSAESPSQGLKALRGNANNLPPRVRGGRARRFKKLLIVGLLTWPAVMLGAWQLMSRRIIDLPGPWEPTVPEMLAPSVAATVIGAILLIPAWRQLGGPNSRKGEDLMIVWSSLVTLMGIVVGAATYPAYALLVPVPFSLITLAWLAWRHGRSTG